MGGTVSTTIDLKNTTAYVELLKAYKDLCKKVDILTKNCGKDVITHTHSVEDIIDLDSYIIQSTSYIHNQSVASNIWIINHNLGYKPGGILVQDSAEEIWVGSIDYINDNSLTITFNNAFSGKAYIS